MFKIEVFFGSIDPEFNNFLGTVYSLAPPTVGMRMVISIPEKNLIRYHITIKDVVFLHCFDKDDKTQTVLISC